MNRLRLWLPLLLGILVVASAVAQVQVSKTSMAYGAIRVYTEKVDSFYVKYTGAVDTAITSVTFNKGRFFTVEAAGGNMTPTLAPGDSVMYHVTYHPDSVGSTTDSIVVHLTGGPRVVGLSGSGLNNIKLLNTARAAITSLSWVTDTLRPGVTKVDSFRVVNIADYAISVTGLTNANPEFVFTPSTPFTAPANDTVWVYTAYTGTSPGRDTDTLVIAHDDSAKNSSPVKLGLSGRSSASLRFSVYSGNTNRNVTIDESSYYATSASLSFTASYTATSTPTFTAFAALVTNGSTVPGIGIDSVKLTRVQVFNDLKDSVRVDSVSFTTSFWKSIVPTPYVHRVGAAYDRNISFEFRPKEVKVYTDTLFLWSNDPNGSPIKLVVKGQGVRRVHVVNTANAASLAFGNVASGLISTLPLRILNLQDIGLTVDSVALLLKHPKYSIISGPVAATVAAGQEIQFQVAFNAADTVGGPTFRDTVLVYANGFQAAPFRIPLSGTVLNTITFLPTSVGDSLVNYLGNTRRLLNVGDYPVSTFKDTTIKIFNRTATNYTIDGLSLKVNSPYVITSNTLSQPLNAGDSVAITVRFSPTAGGTFRDTLVISHNIPVSLLTPLRAPLTSPFLIPMVGTGNTNAVLDPVDYLTVDNAVGIDGFAIQSTDSAYKELGPFWGNTVGFNGNHRRAPNLAGSAFGSAARYTFTIDSTGPYLAYHFMTNSPNAGANYYVHFRKFGVTGVADSMRYTLLDNNSTFATAGTFFPLAVHHFNGFGPGAMSVTIGADERSSTFMRLDAVRLLRTQLPADVEFGRRDINFGPIRVPEEVPQVTVGDEYTRTYRLWNIGKDTLKISNMVFHPTRTPVAWFYIKNYTPGQSLNIPPVRVDAGIESGGYSDITVAFNPFQEGDARDSLVISSNDEKEPNAYIIWVGSGLNYNFILNASLGGTEPHFRAPAPPEVATQPRYFELATGSWLNSTASPLFPITTANLSSRVNTGGVATLPHECYFEFEMPEKVFGTIDAFGDYIFEHSGPHGSTNAYDRARMLVTHQSLIPPDSAVLNANNQLTWRQVGGPLKTFKLAPGGKITVTLTRNAQTDASGGTTGLLLRADLLRIRKVPSGALIGVNVATGSIIDFGDVNFRNPGGPTGTLNKKEITIGSRGESQIVISNIRFRSGALFTVVNAPPAYPMYLRALNGEVKLTLAFSPTNISAALRDTLEIVSNSTRDSVLLVPVLGNGIGGVFTIDDDGATADRAAYPALQGVYLDKWDLAFMTRWQIQTVTKADSIAIGQSRRMLAMKLNRTGFFEWYPQLPAPEPGGSDSMYAAVYAAIPAGLTDAAPAAKYSVFPGAGGPRKDTVLSQNGRTAVARGVEEVFLGNHWFIRGARDSYRDSLQGAGAGIFGHVRVSSDTAAANFAGSDTLALVADAIILRELEAPPSIPVGVEESEIPTEFALDQNYPNPFNPSTTIRFALPMRANVDLKIYDLLGREVRVLLRGDQIAPGVHSVMWDGRNSIGHAVATGVYFYRINASGFTESRKMLLLK